MSATAIAESSESMTHPFVRQMVVQLRAVDSYGTYDNWTDDKVLDPLILTKERKREIPVVGDPDEIVVSRLKAYYNALATNIEKEVGLMAVPMVNLTHEGFGRAFITIGKLVVLDKTLRDVHRFGFASLEKLCEESAKIIDKAVALASAHPEVARL
ncbi:MAG: NifX-associated nitrogen fixation protein [Pseudomonadales bacterium]|nr:NifX-associated nitrogen fixation protein [Pseudomonadales bacterium]